MDGTDLGWYLSSGGSSEGGAKSATPIVDATDNNVFADVSSAARIAGGTEIRKIFLENDHATDPYDPHSIWISTAPSHCTAELGLGFDDVDDDEPTGGNLVAFGAAAQVAFVSDAADDRSVDVHGQVAGVPTIETVVLNGTSEVLTAAAFDVVDAMHTVVSASRTVSIAEGSGGTVRGTIDPGVANCFRWQAAASKSAGSWRPSLVAGASEGIWERISWSAGAIVGVQDVPLATEAI